MTFTEFTPKRSFQVRRIGLVRLRLGRDTLPGSLGSQGLRPSSSAYTSPVAAKHDTAIHRNVAHFEWHFPPEIGVFGIPKYKQVIM